MIARMSARSSSRHRRMSVIYRPFYRSDVRAQGDLPACAGDRGTCPADELANPAMTAEMLRRDRNMVYPLELILWHEHRGKHPDAHVRATARLRRTVGWPGHGADGVGVGWLVGG